MLSGDNGILQKATDAKTQTGVGQEKETIALAYNSALAKKVIERDSSAVNANDMNTEFQNEGTKATATDGTNKIEIAFESGNSYTIDSSGNINPSEPKVPSNTLKVAEHKNEKFSTNTELEDSFGNKITVPAGFKITSDSPDNVIGGVIIEDVDAGTTETTGSQFVWIPVGTVYGNSGKTDLKTITLGRYDFDSNGIAYEYGVLSVSQVKTLLTQLPDDKNMVDEALCSGAYDELSSLKGKEDSEIQSWIDNGSYVEKTLENMMVGGCIEENNFREGSLTSKKNATAKDLDLFISSANSKGGYYVGRYEARTVESVKRNKITTNDDELAKMTEKANEYVYNYITQPQASKLARNMYESQDFESDLINSYAWDTTILFLQTYGESNYSNKRSVNSSLAEKGTNFTDYTGTKDIVCNIYDIASNCWELTTETYFNTESPYTMRGDSIYTANSTTKASSRSTYTKNSYTAFDSMYCFRPILYVK